MYLWNFLKIYYIFCNLLNNYIKLLVSDGFPFLISVFFVSIFFHSVIGMFKKKQIVPLWIVNTQQGVCLQAPKSHPDISEILESININISWHLAQVKIKIRREMARSKCMKMCFSIIEIPIKNEEWSYFPVYYHAIWS